MTKRSPPTPPELDELARQFLDLWQDQLALMASDPETHRVWWQALEQWGTAFAMGAVPPGNGAQASSGPGPTVQTSTEEATGDAACASTRSTADRGKTRRATRAAPVGAAPTHGPGAVDEFAERMSALEQRISALETTARPSRRHAKGKARRQRHA